MADHYVDAPVIAQGENPRHYHTHAAPPNLPEIRAALCPPTVTIGIAAETTILGDLCSALERVPAEARHRLIRYVADRYGCKL